MWLRRLVGIVMIVTCVGLSVLTVLGVVVPDKASKQAAILQASAAKSAMARDDGHTALPVAPPTVALSGQTSTISAGSSTGLTWTTTGSPTSCKASGSWDGDKTAFGSESTGRISSSGNYTYTLSCSNAGGVSEASTTITVGTAVAPAQTHTSATTPVAPTQVYCGGRLPCYGTREVGGHSDTGNCWGWNGERVINISGLDAAYHEVKSGISSIQIGSICGHDLGPALSGQASAEGKTRNHNQTTKSNADINEVPYFTGYFDANKP